jgi:hypothetical protein
MADKRKYLLMESKYGDKKHPQFWGKRSESSQPRSYNGYTNDPVQAELYSFAEIMDHFADSNSIDFLPIETWYGLLARYTPADWQNHQNNDDIFVITEEEALEIL